ncbi:MAG: amino acid permease [Bacteroidia bacterium]|jgi:APA family basic amino acid/polyamine antiporter|nr:amino acid permease [Bacteroidia bacterium]
MGIFSRKNINQLLQESEKHELKRTLGAGNLVALGVGAIIGAGLFVRTASAAAEASGPAVTISFMVAALGCAFAGLCYAEFAAMIPIAGSAYAYSYVTMGELVAWIIGWALIMEYALGAATVSIAWSEYLNNLFNGAIPYEWCHSPFEALHRVTAQHLQAIISYQPSWAAMVKNGELILTEEQFSSLPSNLSSLVMVTNGIVNLPALLVLAIITLVLIRGTQESAIFNAIIVFVKVAIVLLFIGIGWQYINPINHTPYFIPENAIGHEGFFKHGIGGIFGGAAIVFFAFIGFDAVSTAAQEAKNPKRDMPIGILGSLVVCTILYILFGHVLTGVANWQEFKTAGKEASVAYAIQTYMKEYQWLATSVTVAILAGFSSVILVMLMGQSRVFFSMSNDGLMPKVLSDLHPKFKTPYKANLILFVFVGLFSAFVPGSVAGDLTSFGTLFAFVLVSAGVWIMRVKSPEIPRPFKTPLVPIVPILGVLVCTLMIIALDAETLKVAAIWMLVGLIVYFIYGKRNSKLNKAIKE